MAEGSDSLPFAVIGAGATGLAAAHALVQRGHRVRLFEAGERIGGPVQSVRDGDWLVEAGPNTIQESAEVSELITQLGLQARRQTAQAAAKNRYILRGGKPVAAPTSPPGLFSSPLFSFGTKVRVFSELLRPRRVRTTDISLAEFIESHFGRELVDYGLNPFVSGVYAGDPQKLSARYAFPTLWAAERSHGSIIRAQIAAAKERKRQGDTRRGPPAIISFDEGLATLMQSLVAKLPAGSLELGARVQTLVRDEAWKLVWSRDGETHTESFSRVLFALPASALARLSIGSLGERPLAELEAIDYPPVTSVFLGYRREQVKHPLDGFGLLIPQREHRQVLGVLFSSTLFAGRAPEGHVALTVIVGGMTRPDLGRAPIEQLMPLVQRELAELLGVSGDPVYQRHHNWPRAIPQYNLGYGRFLDAMTRFEETHPGLLIGGHVRDGIALSACLSAGRKLAERASD